MMVPQLKVKATRLPIAVAIAADCEGAPALRFLAF
jgi:hypothetical protein